MGYDKLLGISHNYENYKDYKDEKQRVLKRVANIYEVFHENKKYMFDIEGLYATLWFYIDTDENEDSINYVLEKAGLPIIDFPDVDELNINWDIYDSSEEDIKAEEVRCMEYLYIVDKMILDYLMLNLETFG